MSKLIGVPLSPTTNSVPRECTWTNKSIVLRVKTRFCKTNDILYKSYILFCRLKEYWLKSCQIFFYTTLSRHIIVHREHFTFGLVTTSCFFFAADTPCQLHCKPENKFFSVMMRDIVIDGTPCKAGTRNMCISGRCRVWFSPRWYESATNNFNVHCTPKDVLIKTVASEHQLHFMHCNFLHISCMILKHCFLSFGYSLYIYTWTLLLYILLISYLSTLDATGE